MPADPLRSKLKALVEEWYEEEKEERIQGSLMIAATLRACRKQLAALLAESEPEPLVATVDRLQGILNRVQQALAKYAGDDAYRVPQESLPLLIVSLLSSKAALLPSAAIAVGSTVVPGGSTTGHSVTPTESEPEPERYLKPAPKKWGLSGHLQIHPEAKAKLPLGHEFVAALDSLGRSSKSDAYCCGECGQPRSAHEPPDRGRP